MEVNTGFFRNKKHIVILISVAIAAILAVVLITSIKNARPHEIDAPYGPEPFDLKSIKTNIAPASENDDTPEAEDIEIEY